MIINDSARDAEAVVVGTAFRQQCDRLYIGGAGNVTVTLFSGASVTYTAVPVGTYLYVKASIVTAATATNMIAERF